MLKVESVANCDGGGYNINLELKGASKHILHKVIELQEEYDNPNAPKKLSFKDVIFTQDEDTFEKSSASIIDKSRQLINEFINELAIELKLTPVVFTPGLTGETWIPVITFTADNERDKYQWANANTERAARLVEINESSHNLLLYQHPNALVTKYVAFVYPTTSLCTYDTKRPYYREELMKELNNYIEASNNNISNVYSNVDDRHLKIFLSNRYPGLQLMNMSTDLVQIEKIKPPTTLITFVDDPVGFDHFSPTTHKELLSLLRGSVKKFKLLIGTFDDVNYIIALPKVSEQSVHYPTYCKYIQKVIDNKR